MADESPRSGRISPGQVSAERIDPGRIDVDAPASASRHAAPKSAPKSASGAAS